ncbi:MAG: ATP-dependent DNA helicase [Defluviitaleaceae bacterium]|nr:ATP-dependent DNA helicase [Defluviitaleaceae bacterium]MCL2275836.1 ATP-dependent DNA helicase [Defluviitaleaceae bacterium]
MKISVSKIIELILRSGDIDARFRDASAMYKGAAAHRKLQGEAGENYKKEVALKLDIEIEGIPVTLQGRADGIITTQKGFTIDEIKSTAMPLDVLFQQHAQHLGQAKCYAYMYIQTLQAPPQAVTIQLTYFQLESEAVKRHSWDFTVEEIEAFFTDLLRKYGAWLKLEHDWKQTRDASIGTARFPFPAFRKGQREFAAAAYRTIIARKKLYAAAPTGIGKTLSALFPAIKAMGEEACEKIFYLTAKTITRTVAQDAAALMAEKGLRIKVLSLRAKDKLCPHSMRNCSPDYCQNANGHYDRVNDALWDVLNNEDIITPAVITQYAQKHQVCPHEYALDAALYSDVIIGDYNHVFDPGAYLRRFFNTNEKREYVFLIDEAHNLADRVRDMYSANIQRSTLRRAAKQLRGRDAYTAALRKAFKQADNYLKDLIAEDESSRAVKEADAVLNAFIILLHIAMGEWLNINKNNAPEYFGEMLDLYFTLDTYMLTAELYDDHFTTLAEINGKDITMTQFCVDPAALITQGLTRGIASVLFSATLTPLPYYREILGGSIDDPVISLPSPFDPAKLTITVHHQVSAKYAHRANSYAPIADIIYHAVNAKQGNYLVFFPSYAYLNEVYLRFYEKYPHISTLVQQSNMTEDDREDFLDQFAPDPTEALVGFTVLGGIFSEGIDLTGNRLIGAIIISVGIPMVNLRQEQIRAFYNQKNGAGYDYAYTFPGMNKVLQAAGRVIRTETDEGTLHLIDTRFKTAQYRALFPTFWRV